MAVAGIELRVDIGNGLKVTKALTQQTKQLESAVNGTTQALTKQGREVKIAANGVKYFTDAAGRARAENGRFLSSAERAAAGIRKQGRAAQQASGKFSGLGSALRSLGAGLALRKTFLDASELQSAQSRIGLLTKNFSQLTGIEELAASAARKFNLSQAESLNSLTDLGNRIGPTGASLEDIKNVYEGFNTLLALNKVNTQNAASATLQLNQALGSGRLAGEEFNAISEATPQLLDAVAKVMGRNRGELKKLASDGQISSQVLIEALKRIKTEGAADLETAFGGAFGATRRLDAAFKDFSATIGTELLPAITPLINGATTILKQFGGMPAPIKTTAAAIFGLAAAAAIAAPAFAAISLSSLPWIALTAGIVAATVAIGNAANAQNNFNQIMAYAPLEEVQAKVKGLENQLVAAEQKLQTQIGLFGDLSSQALFAQASVDALRGALEQAQGDYQVRLLYQTVGVTPDAKFLGPGFKAPQPKAKPFALPTSTSKPTKGGGKKERESQLADINAANGLFRSQQTIVSKIAEAELNKNTAEVLRLQLIDRNVKLLHEAATIQRSTVPLDEKQAQLRGIQDQLLASSSQYTREIAQFQKEAVDGFPSYIEGLASAASGYSATLEYSKQLTEQQKQQQELADGIANTVGSGMASAFDALIEGSENFGASLRKIASGVLKDIAKQLIQIYVINQAISAISSLFGPKTSGFAPGAGGFGGGFGGGFDAGIPAIGNTTNFASAFGGKRAMGGSVTGGRSYMVGERGPELFSPGRSGGIAPTGSFGGSTNVVVNVDASGSNVQGDQAQAKALGNAISAAVQSELVKQKRPGGLLA
jgi:tape measure domain-containing protein